MTKINYLFIILLLALTFITCKKDKDSDDPVRVVLDSTPYNFSYGALPDPNLPDDNVITIQGVKLGRMLFYEEMLSKDNTQSCASCHRQEHGFSDTTMFSIGVEDLPGLRQAMPIINMAWQNNEFFWDGRAHLLRDQALKPIQDPLEMNETLDNAISKLKGSQMYLDQFTRAFGDDDITPLRMSLALEQFEFSIVSHDSKYDKVLAGTASFTESEQRGKMLFEEEYNEFFPESSGADCVHCHGGSNFKNDQYMNNGLDEVITDIGREGVTMDVNDRGKFKVPSLRNIELTRPYMHDGRFQTLEEVIDHYNEGIKESATTDPTVLNTMNTGLFLTEQDKVDLVNFLKTLTDQSFINNPAYKTPF